jgi:hypothetical protein
MGGAAPRPNHRFHPGALMARTPFPAAAPHRATAVSRTSMALTVLALGLLILLAVTR